jgi:hypothetical protein
LRVVAVRRVVFVSIDRVSTMHTHAPCGAVALWRGPPSEEKPWSTMNLVDLRHAIEQGETIELTAALLGRSVKDVQRKAKELNPIKNSDR